MNQKYYIGVDISKEKVDIAVLNESFGIILEKKVPNNQPKLNTFFKSLMRKLKCAAEDFLVCCEETGIYKEPLKVTCLKLELPLWIEMAIKVKKASSSIRGKSDRQDAYRIAEYALRYKDRQRLHVQSDSNTSVLQTLLNARETLLEKLVALQQPLNESKQFDKEKYDLLKTCFEKPIKAIKKQLYELEMRIGELVEANAPMKENMELLKSIPGIGRQNALQFIVYTNNFRLFESPKHLACYAGVAPFANESGTIIKRAKVSSFANKKLKKLLHLAAMSCIRTKGELKDYYVRKVAEGKNKMLVLNNIRNKLVKRIMAVVKRKSEYLPSIKIENKICILP